MPGPLRYGQGYPRGGEPGTSAARSVETTEVLGAALAMQLMLALARLSALRGHLLVRLRHACGTLDGNRCRLSQALVAWGAAGLRECRCCGCSTSSPAAGIPIHAEAAAAPPVGLD